MMLRPHNIALIALLLITSLSLFIWWATNIQRLSNLNWQPLPPDTPTLPNFGLRTANLTTSTQSLDRPLFWESRRPQTEPTSRTTQPTAAPVPMELLGIVSEGNQRIALLRPLQGTAPLLVQRLRQGDSAQGINIQSIDNNSVTIQSINGTQTLKIVRGSLSQPKQQLQPGNTQSIEMPTMASPNATLPDKINTDGQIRPRQTAQERSEQMNKDIQKHIENLKRKSAQQDQPTAQ